MEAKGTEEKYVYYKYSVYTSRCHAGSQSPF